MALFGSKASRLIGLDIGSSSVKVVALQQSRGGYQVEAAGVGVLPAGTIVEGVIAKPEGVVSLINRIFESENIKENQVAGSVSGHAVIVKKIALPVSNPEEVAESIQWEAEQYIPFDIADVYLDYHLLGPTEDGTGTNVILVAAKRETVDSQSDVISISGRQPMVMDIDAFALHNAYEVNYAPDPDSVVALLNIGASIMNVNIAAGDKFIFTRDIGMGGNYYTEYVQRDLGISYEEAEQYKKGESPDELKLTVSSVLQSVSEILALEVQKTFDYFRTTSEFEEMQSIYICGGASRTEGLREYLQETFQVPVEYLSPFQAIQGSGSNVPDAVISNGSEFAVAVGLALRQVGDKPSAASSGATSGWKGFLNKLTKR
ncbi:MAG: type IV pilus assembly protein PilM [Acidobacteriota bacterium]